MSIIGIIINIQVSSTLIHAFLFQLNILSIYNMNLEICYLVNIEISITVIVLSLKVKLSKISDKFTI